MFIGVHTHITRCSRSCAPSKRVTKTHRCSNWTFSMVQASILFTKLSDTFLRVWGVIFLTFSCYCVFQFLKSVNDACIQQIQEISIANNQVESGKVSEEWPFVCQTWKWVLDLREKRFWDCFFSGWGATSWTPCVHIYKLIMCWDSSCRLFFHVLLNNIFVFHVMTLLDHQFSFGLPHPGLESLQQVTCSEGYAKQDALTLMVLHPEGWERRHEIEE